MEKIKNIWLKLVSILTPLWEWLKPKLVRLHQWRKRIWKKYQINKIILLVGLVIVLLTSIYLFYLAKSANVATLKSGLSQVTTVYDKEGQEAGTLYGQKGTFVDLSAISPYVVDAVISTEDRRFYEHKGFDVRGIARSFLGILKSGRITGGGSTVTQQLAKNAYLNLDQTIDRKAKELFLAIEIEKTYTKNEILEMYLNNAYFANGVWGIQDASHKYFGKDALNLTIDEAAVLVGMLKGPGYYNPIDNMEKALNRRDTVLQLMVDNKKLTNEQASQLMGQELYLTDTYTEGESGYRYPYFFDAVINEAENIHKISDEDLLNKGYKIYTTLDQNYQQDLQTSFANDYLFPPNASDGVMVQGASVVLNPQTGGVEAVVGGRGEHVYRGFNRATDAAVSPGSTLKPISVYTAALEAGYQPESILKDEALSYYDVQNYDKIYRGEVSLAEALTYSYNSPAVWLLNEIGIETGVKKVEQFGIILNEKDHYPGLALGGLTKGTSPLKMASAYSVFANKGKQKKAHFITKIVDATGVVVVDNTDAKEKKVTTEAVAEKMTGMLKNVFTQGTGVNAQPVGYEIAGKTGTTESVNAADQARDQWIIGYTPDVVVATWIGFDKSSEIHYLTGSSGGSMSSISGIFRDETQRILAHSPRTPFSSETEKNKPPLFDAEKVEGQLDEFGNKVKEGANYWGGRVKEGASRLKETVKDVWQVLTE